MSEDITPRLRQVEKVLVDLVCRLDEILAYPNGFLERARALLGVGLRPTALLGTPFAWRHKAPVSEWVPVVGPSLSHHWLNWLTGTSKLQICREVVPSTGTPVPARDDFRGRGRSSAPDLSRRLLQAEHPVFLLNLASFRGGAARGESEDVTPRLTHYPGDKLGTVRTPPDVAALRGKDLACWCPLDQPCHADVLLELANAD